VRLHTTITSRSTLEKSHVQVGIHTYMYDWIHERITGVVRVGVKIPQDGNRTNRCDHERHVSMFGARFAVFVRRARVLPSPLYATRNLSFLRFHRHRHPVVSTCCSLGWYGLV
jgi:hypothetical protein